MLFKNGLRFEYLFNLIKLKFLIMKKLQITLLMLIVTLFSTSCKKKETTPEPEPTPVIYTNDVVFKHTTTCNQKVKNTYATVYLYRSYDWLKTNKYTTYHTGDTLGKTTIPALYVDTIYYYKFVSENCTGSYTITDKFTVKSGTPLIITYK